MNCSAIAAPAAAFPPSLYLPIEAPRESWPGLIEHAASALEGFGTTSLEILALELRAIAEALRVDGHADLCDALRDCIEASQPMAQMHATENARAVQRRVGGAA